MAQDFREAMKWYTMAAQQGESRAQYNIGVMYDRGKGEYEQDLTAAFRWFKMAADQGNVRALYNLACCYDFGEGWVLFHAVVS